MRQKATRNTAISLRMPEAQRNLIDRAAAVTGKPRTEFMVEASCREAENVLLDQRYFALDEAGFAAFMDKLEAPVKDNPALRELMARKAPWE